MLQIKNTLGGGKPEGLYVWKKYDLVKKYNINSVKYSTSSNPIDVTALCNEKDGNFYLPCFSSSTYTVNSEGYFEFSNIAMRKYISIPSDGSTINFDNALGTYRYFCLQSTNFPDEESDLIMSPTANEIFDQNMADTYTYAKYDSSTDRVIVYEQYASNYFIGLTTEEYYEPNSFLNYIVSDKETAYPDGGEKGGYWYERVSEGITPEMFGATKKEEQTFTVSSSVSTKTITHSLGEIPKLVLCFPSENTCSESVGPFGTLMVAMMRMYQGSNFTSYPGYGVYAGIYSPSDSSKSKGRFSGDVLDGMFPSNSQVKLFTSANFISGNTYKVILLA